MLLECFSSTASSGLKLPAILILKAVVKVTEISYFVFQSELKITHFTRFTFSYTRIRLRLLFLISTVGDINCESLPPSPHSRRGIYSRLEFRDMEMPSVNPVTATSVTSV